MRCVVFVICLLVLAGLIACAAVWEGADSNWAVWTCDMFKLADRCK